MDTSSKWNIKYSNMAMQHNSSSILNIYRHNIVRLSLLDCIIFCGCYENNNFLHLDQNEIAMAVLLQYYLTTISCVRRNQNVSCSSLTPAHFRSKKYFATLLNLENVLQAGGCSCCYLKCFEFASKGAAGLDLQHHSILFRTSLSNSSLCKCGNHASLFLI